MSENKTAKKKVNISTRFLLLAVFGIFTSIYLVYHHVQIVGGYQLGPSVCNIGGDFDCDAVAKSKYSVFRGIPVASFGLFYYLGILFLLLFYRFSKFGRDNKKGFIGVFSIIALIGLLPTLAMVYISWFIIKKWCLFCGLLYLLNLCFCFLCFRELLSTESLFKELLAGLLVPFRVLIIGFSSAFLVIVLLASAFFSLLLPGLFESLVFRPAVSELTIQQLYNDWLKRTPVEIEIFDSGNYLERDFIIGSKTAEVTVVEFSDFQCPFCQRAAKTLKPYVYAKPDKVRLVFKNFPLDKLCNAELLTPPHELACQASVFARCAAAEKGDDGFWTMHDALFSLMYEEWDFSNLLALPKKFGFDAAQIDKCVSEGKALERVREDVELGTKIEVSYTPSIYINQRLVKVSRLDQLPKLIDLILQKKGE